MTTMVQYPIFDWLARTLGQMVNYFFSFTVMPDIVAFIPKLIITFGNKLAQQE